MHCPGPILCYSSRVKWAVKRAVVTLWPLAGRCCLEARQRTCVAFSWEWAIIENPKFNAPLPQHVPHDISGLYSLLACELGRHDGAVGTQGDAVALQPCSEPLLQQLPLQAQVQ